MTSEKGRARVVFKFPYAFRDNQFSSTAISVTEMPGVLGWGLRGKGPENLARDFCPVLLPTCADEVLVQP